MKCKDIMTKDIKWCVPECSVKKAVQIMEVQNCGVLPVIDEEMHVQAIVTDRDITLFLGLQDKSPEKVQLKEFMHKDVITCQEEQDLDELISKMKQYKIRRIPIVDSENRLKGIISLGDIAIKAPSEEHKIYEVLEKVSKSIRFSH